MDDRFSNPTKSQRDDKERKDKEEEVESFGEKPAGTSPESIGVVETPERTLGTKKEKVPEFPSLNEQVQEKEAVHTPPEAPQEAEDKTPNVIDQTNTLTDMKPIKKPGDKLTKEADDEEERFIEEVEKHHGLI